MNTKNEGTHYLANISKVIRPMCQLTAGIHCNIEELVEEWKYWPSYFESKNSDYKPQVEKKWTKILAKNFIKICVSMKGR